MGNQGMKKSRMANLELLRCIAMMMVVVLHYLGKSGLLGNLERDNLTTVNTAAWVLESFCIVAVNVYMLISGYFMCESTPKLSRLVKLWLQVWFYSMGVGLLAQATGLMPKYEMDTYYWITLILPVFMEHYWFITAYVFLYLFLPFVSAGIRKMTKPQMKLAIGMLLLLFSVLKSVLPFRLEKSGHGYDCIWYLCVFLVAAYIRKFGLPILEKKWRGICLYVVACLGIFAETMGIHKIYVETYKMEYMLTVATEYNHILPFLAALGLFMTFRATNVSGILAKVVCFIGPYTLGVYLLHENVSVRTVWQDWFGAYKVWNVPGLITTALTAAVTIFVCGIIVDFARNLLMKGLHFVLNYIPLYRKVVGKIEEADHLFQKEA